ncbi:hypothetical protein KSP40_PGU005663 [Platanthera guangdongensis]|uniref:Ycf15 n=1 Tax=Platanthera guangdongensis TaxID=2320717 RepID=A0ABR2M275_9ASPA
MDRLGDEFGNISKRRPLQFWLLKGQSCRVSEVSNVHNRPWYHSYFQSKKERAWRRSEGYC